MAGNKYLHIEHDSHVFADVTGMAFRGLTISSKNDIWNVVVRATDLDGEPVYAIFQHEDVTEAISSMERALKSKEVKYLWRSDGWARA